MDSLSEDFNILIVEDNPADQYLLQEMLTSSRLGINQLFTAPRLADAISLLQQQTIHFILLDLSLPDSFGIESLTSLREITKQIPIIILTGLSDTEVALEALNQNAQDYLVKGEFNVGLLVKSVEYSLERKKIEERIRSSEQKYRQMFYQNPFPMWVNDVNSLQILEVNDAAIQKYGYTREEFLQLSIQEMQLPSIPGDDIESNVALHEKFRKHKKKNGEIMIVDLTSHLINFFGRTAMQTQVIDMTEKVALETELAFQKQRMLEAVLNAQENERKAIGQELHDNINQILTAIKLNLDLAWESRANDNGFFVANCMKSISTVMQEVRKLSKELIMPSGIRELGIVNSIEDLMKEMLQPSGIEWQFSAEGLVDHPITEEQKINIYRIIQEQLTNILKHASATRIKVSLTLEAGTIHMLIWDNGKGFDPTKKREGVGVTNIISRAELFCGKVKIDSAPGKGCSMEVTLKLQENQLLNKATKTQPIPIIS